MSWYHSRDRAVDELERHFHHEQLRSADISVEARLLKLEDAIDVLQKAVIQLQRLAYELRAHSPQEKLS